MKLHGIILSVFVIMLFSLNVAASVDEVYNYLDKAGETEYVDFELREVGSDLFILAERKEYEIEDDGFEDFVSAKDDILRRMCSEIDIEYENIYVTTISKNPLPFIFFNQYNLEYGCNSRYGDDGIGSSTQTWLINDKNSLDEETYHFLMAVVKELLNVYNIPCPTNLGYDGDEVEVQEFGSKYSRSALIQGTYDCDGKTYSFITEFNYKKESGINGTYDEIFISVNDINLFGEYKEPDLFFY